MLKLSRIWLRLVVEGKDTTMLLEKPKLLGLKSDDLAILYVEVT